MTPQDIRNLRLKNDYKEMLNIKGSIISWEVIKGAPPYVEEYKMTINVRGIIQKGPTYRNSHTMQIVLPANYPTAAPDVRMTSTPYVFHPNWYRDGKWCYGTWYMAESLGNHVIRMVKSLRYDLDITNEHSPANRDAKTWFLANKNKGIFPCDHQTLPDPTKKRMIINPTAKKKFEIK